MRKRNKKILMFKKIAVVLAAVVLIVSATIGGTLAWLTDDTDTVTNTFTVGDINIDLNEDGATGANGELKKEYNILPGVDLSKDPYVTIDIENEECYVFVKITESNWPTYVETDGTTKKVRYDLNLDNGTADTSDDWTKLEGISFESGETVIWRKFTDDILTGNEYIVCHLIKDNTVYVSNTLTKKEMQDIAKIGSPSLKFEAYAIQIEKSSTAEFTAAEAWNELNKK